MDYKGLIKEQFDDDKQYILEEFKNVIDSLVEVYFDDKDMFESGNYKTYYFDEYKLKTNVCADTCSILYLEINQLSNIKKFNERSMIQDRYLTLKKIKDDFVELSIQNFDSNTLIWQDKYSINYAINIFDDEENKTTHYFKIIPCFTHLNEDNISGIIYHTNDKTLIEIEYPKLSIRNYNLKNKNTNDMYRQYILLFKNAYKIDKNEKILPFEIFEILLYCVPDSYFTDFNNGTILKILDYIKNCGISMSKTIDQQQDAFKSKYKSLSSLYASMVIKRLIKIFSKKSN